MNNLKVMKIYVSPTAGADLTKCKEELVKICLEHKANVQMMFNDIIYNVNYTDVIDSILKSNP